MIREFFSHLTHGPETGYKVFTKKDYRYRKKSTGGSTTSTDSAGLNTTEGTFTPDIQTPLTSEPPKPSPEMPPVPSTSSQNDFEHVNVKDSSSPSSGMGGLVGISNTDKNGQSKLKEPVTSSSSSLESGNMEKQPRDRTESSEYIVVNPHSPKSDIAFTTYPQDPVEHHQLPQPAIPATIPEESPNPQQKTFSNQNIDTQNQKPTEFAYGEDVGRPSSGTEKGKEALGTHLKHENSEIESSFHDPSTAKQKENLLRENPPDISTAGLESTDSTIPETGIVKNLSFAYGEDVGRPPSSDNHGRTGLGTLLHHQEQEKKQERSAKHGEEISKEEAKETQYKPDLPPRTTESMHQSLVRDLRVLLNNPINYDRLLKTETKSDIEMKRIENGLNRLEMELDALTEEFPSLKLSQKSFSGVNDPLKSKNHQKEMAIRRLKQHLEKCESGVGSDTSLDQEYEEMKFLVKDLLAYMD